MSLTFRDWVVGHEEVTEEFSNPVHHPQKDMTKGISSPTFPHASSHRPIVTPAIPQQTHSRRGCQTGRKDGVSAGSDLVLVQTYTDKCKFSGL